MADLNRPAPPDSILEEPRKRTDTINVLTILTFIGSGLGILFQCYYMFNAKKLYDTAIASQANLDKAPAWARSLQGPDPIGVATRTFENRIPINLLAFIALVLCIYGAIEMRKLKKTGFYIYVIGELVLPLLSTALFIGTAAMGGIGFGFGVFFMLLFIILYATQLKHMQ